MLITPWMFLRFTVNLVHESTITHSSFVLYNNLPCFTTLGIKSSETREVAYTPADILVDPHGYRDQMSTSISAQPPTTLIRLKIHNFLLLV